jgi:hypothetical protein
LDIVLIALGIAFAIGGSVRSIVLLPKALVRAWRHEPGNARPIHLFLADRLLLGPGLLLLGLFVRWGTDSVPVAMYLLPVTLSLLGVFVSVREWRAAAIEPNGVAQNHVSRR